LYREPVGPDARLNGFLIKQETWIHGREQALIVRVSWLLTVPNSPGTRTPERCTGFETCGSPLDDGLPALVVEQGPARDFLARTPASRADGAGVIELTDADAR
jgi:hypothetical protein